MDYEKKYKEALELARVAAFNGHQSLMEGIFPELKEPEDEKVREEIINYLVEHDVDGYLLHADCEKWVAWLEKQSKESKVEQAMREVEEKAEAFTKAHKGETSEGILAQMKGEEKPAVWSEEDERIRKMLINSFTRADMGGEIYGKGVTYKQVIAWLEKQAEPSIKWNKNTEGNKPQVNHSVLMKTTHGIAEGEWQGEYWHQYRWAGIVIDSDVIAWMELSDLEKQGEQKPAWSEEDEVKINRIVACLENLNVADNDILLKDVDWLKSLKQRIGGKL